MIRNPMARLLSLLCCLGCSSVSMAASAPREVVLVHGFLETGYSFRTIRKKLEAQGHRCLVVRMRPSDGRGGLERLATGLKRDIESRFTPGQRFSIVAFSMGGLVARHYLQELGGASRCDHLFTISSPHQGTRTAWLYPSRGACEMRPGSDFLRNLKQQESRLGEMEVISYWSPLDLVILPARSSVWQRAENVRTWSPLHPMMVTSPAVIGDIIRRLGRD